MSELTHDTVAALAGTLSTRPHLPNLDPSPPIWNGEFAHELFDACLADLTSYKGPPRHAIVRGDGCVKEGGSCDERPDVRVIVVV